MRKSFADPMVSADGEGGAAPGTRAEVPLQSVEKTTVRQAVPLQPMEDHSGADLHTAACEDPTPEQTHLLCAKYPLQVVSKSLTETKKKKKKRKKIKQKKPKRSLAITDGPTISSWDFLLNLIRYKLMQTSDLGC